MPLWQTCSNNGVIEKLNSTHSNYDAILPLVNLHFFLYYNFLVYIEPYLNISTEQGVANFALIVFVKYSVRETSYLCYGGNQEIFEEADFLPLVRGARFF